MEDKMQKQGKFSLFDLPYNNNNNAITEYAILMI